MYYRPAEGAEGVFRIVVNGTVVIDLQIPVSAVFPQEAFKDLIFHAQFQPGMVNIQTNATASKWVDLISLVQSQDIDVTDAVGDIVTEGFLSNVEKLSTPDCLVAAAWRWQLAVADDGSSLELQLQSLPAGADSLLSLPVFRSKIF
jgi:hypothetical protein